jgi:serine protease Do
MTIRFSFLISCVFLALIANQGIGQVDREKSKADTTDETSKSDENAKAGEGDSATVTSENPASKPTEADSTTFVPTPLSFLKPASIEDIKELESHLQKVRDIIRPATVNLGGGSGVVISKEGLILTVAHVGRNAGRRISVVFPDGKRVRGEILGNYHGIDAGLAKITEKGEYPFVEMGDSEALQRGQWCIAAGYPVSFSRSQQPPIRLGRVLRTSSRTIVTDCTIMGGDSGGPLFDLDGRVIGMNSRVGGSLTSNIHVPISVYQENWERLIKGEDWGQSRESRGQNPRERTGPYLGLRRNRDVEGAIVGGFFQNSPSEKAGIKVGDKITEFNGKPVENGFREIYRELRNLKSGDEVVIKVERGKEKLEFKVKL